MFYVTDDELKNAVLNSGTSIILENSVEKLERIFKNAIVIRAEDNKDTKGISIAQVREVIDLCTTATKTNKIFIFKNAETLRPEAQNAILKLLEEPKENYHFVLQTTAPEALLPTIRSRALTYAPLTLNALERPPEAEKAVFDTAKRLLVANSVQVIEIADELMKKKDTESSPRRDFTLDVLKTTIELAEKSYFKTKNEAFTRKIRGLIAAHKAIVENGNIRLQIVANLV